MATVEIYSSDFCPFCRAARRLLDDKGIDYTLYDVDGEPARRREMMDRGARHTVPQIFIEGRSVGGYDDIAALDSENRLDPLLGGP